jgi:hypothetical protein
LGNQLGKQLEPLGHQLADEDAEAREVAARSGETGGPARRHRVAAAEEDDRDRRGCVFRRQYRSAACYHHVDLKVDQVGSQCGQPIIISLRPAIFDRDVFSLNIAGFAQPLAERGHIRCIRTGGTADEVADHRHRLLLRTHRQRPTRHRAADEGDDVAA